MSRSANVKKNLIFNMLKYATDLIMKFVVRTVLIYLLGVQYVGLNGLFSNIFTFLNLAELGIGSAIVFAMYKPIAENDTQKVKALQNLYKKFYIIIACVVMGLGLIILPFIKYLIKGDVTADVNLYVLFAMYLVNAVVGYLSAHKRSLLFAYQRNDVENKVRTICLLLMSLAQIAVLFIFKNYYIFFAVNIFFTILECILIHIWANKLFPEINGKSEPLDKVTKKEISKNVYALSLHKVGSAVVFSTDNILISSMIGLSVLGAYSNYYLIITGLISIFTLLSNAISASVGNMVASETVDYNYFKFKTINFMFIFLSAFCTICLVVLFQPFIKFWTGGGIYLLNFSSVILLCLSFYLGRMRGSVWVFQDASGLFWQDRWKPIVESVVNLVASIGLGYVMGLNGIILGTIISTIVAPLWVEPFVLYKYYFKRTIKPYFVKYLIDAVVMVAVATICYFVCGLIPDGNIGLFVAKTIVCVLLAVILLTLCYFKTKEFKELWHIGIGFVKSIFNKKSTKNAVNNNVLVTTENVDDTTESADNKTEFVNNTTENVINNQTQNN